MLKLFRGFQPALILLAPLVTGLLWLKGFLEPGTAGIVSDPYEMPFYQLLHWLLDENVYIQKIIAAVLIIISSLWLARMNTRFIILPVRTYLPAFLYLFLCSSMNHTQGLNPALVSGILFIFVFEILYAAENEEGLSYKSFEAALLLSLASFFYAKAALYMIVIWISLPILRPFNWREWAFTIIGFAIPYIFLLTWFYMADKNIAEEFTGIFSNFHITSDFKDFNRFNIIFFSFLLFLIIFSSFKMLREYQGLKIYIRKFFRILFWIFVFTSVIYFVFYRASNELIYFMALPLAYVLTFYMVNIKSKFIAEMLFDIFLVLLVLAVAV